MQTFEIEADSERRILRIRFRGVVTAEEMRAAAGENARLIAGMKPGFSVISDLSELERMDLDCVSHITRLMDLFREAGVARVLRIIPDANKDIGFTLLSHTHYRGEVPFETMATLAEAETAVGATL